MTELNKEVTDFLEGLNLPTRKEIEVLRNCILSANTHLTENIKWNGPNYSCKNEDRITMRIHAQNKVQLIFHRGAKKLEQPKARLIKNENKMLTWKANDRAIITFKNLQEIENSIDELTKIVNDWISSTIKG
jgi:hypothetical protein